MKKLDELLSNISIVAQIPFKIRNVKGDIYTSPNFHIKTTFVERKIQSIREELTLLVCAEDRSALPLLENYIANTIKNEYIKRNDIILNIIENKPFSKGYIEDIYPFLEKEFSMILINTKQNTVNKVISLISDGYKDEEVVIINYNNLALILGKLEDTKEHALSISETLQYSLGEDFLIAYANVDSYEELRVIIGNCLKKVELAQKFNITEGILGENSLLFEEIVDSIDETKKNTLLKQCGKGFDKLDSEMIRTIDIFFKCGLNVSESAKCLYIHRNTLIYRIDKIQKYTGFDIKDFNMSVVFKILFFLWKEKKYK
ncbi:MAG: hypothetical protein E7214_01020 [Clostridium sp.]|nr:hypothetical protein [Clostridium sp.]